MRWNWGLAAGLGRRSDNRYNVLSPDADALAEKLHAASAATAARWRKLLAAVAL
jgi:hypothetical protein